MYLRVHLPTAYVVLATKATLTSLDISLSSEVRALYNEGGVCEGEIVTQGPVELYAKAGASGSEIGCSMEAENLGDSGHVVDAGTL